MEILLDTFKGQGAEIICSCQLSGYCHLAMITPEILSGLEFVLQSSGQAGRHAS